ncbi:MAG: hypothetical protein H8E97_07510 [Bacteroidetes bacterium]|nr:hypothetical protein [Bacteroidota bacterium]
MNKSTLIEHLKSQEIWSIKEVLKLFYGPSNPSEIIRGETHEPMGELLETAANKGRFGMLTTGIDKFYWDMELPPDYPYPDQPLDTITDFSAHHLRFVDWIEDEDVLDKIQLDADKKEEIIDLIETLNEKRTEVKPASHVIDYQRLIEEDFWTLTDLRIVLFGETHPSRYHPYHYRIYNSNQQSLMQRIDIVIHDAGLLGKRIQVHKIQNRPFLIDTANENKQEQDLWEFGYFGVYDTDESGYRSHRYYHSPDLFDVLTLKGFPIPRGLATSLDQNKIKPALELLKKLKENILHLAVHGENPPNTQVDRVDQKSEVEFKGGIEQDFFEKEGDFWIVSIRGEKASGLKHLKGMSYISHLYRNTGEKFHVIKLDQIVHKVQASIDYKSSHAEINTVQVKGKFVQGDLALEAFKNADDTSITGFHEGEKNLSKKELKALLDHKALLEEKLDEAKISNNREEIETSEDNLEKCKKALNIVSFRGKGKTDKPEIKKAREKIFNNIKYAINNIKDKNPTLAQHLSEHVKTGEYCSYIN